MRRALALTSNVIDGARELKDEMKHVAGDVAAEAKKSVESGISASKQRAADGLVGVADAIRKTGEHLRAEDQGTVTPYFDRVARQVDVASEYLQTRTIRQVIRDVEQFARREPAALSRRRLRGRSRGGAVPQELSARVHIDRSWARRAPRARAAS